ncbi:SDR family oxidoreductase [Streptomyces fulvorobeus]|uniref:NAD(P)-dependent oxidoreductase n=1 Tax=Streptomyces fulvorobeus TaxID=284028 RepID=A0A7J0CEY1_9ACTN|nr:SDR family oxidoreductase [Streptomyces fulvorobeus]NYE44507.1 NAD(P)H dehydrogenase (quinone) [Streptomyces fulvorobeus]GFN01042.1 NAD(P)-dependent oxidoreductase [Streptomyces fulvorobeus]
MIVVTGATGQFGHQVIEHLLRRGVPAGRIAAAVRTPAKAADLAARGVEIRLADYERPETLLAAFANADKLLLVSSTGPDDIRIVQHRAAVEAAAKAGVGLIAYTSVTAAPTSPLGLARVHRDTEQAIADSGLPAVLLRNGWYTENYTATLPDAVERGAIAGSAGQGRIASATRADFAEAAAVVLTRDDQSAKVYDLTGDTAWSLPELATESAAQSGKRVTYADLPAQQYRQILTGAGLPDFVTDLIVDADVQVSHGALAHITTDLSGLLGRPTTPLSTAVAQALAV